MYCPWLLALILIFWVLKQLPPKVFWCLGCAVLGIHLVLYRGQVWLKLFPGPAHVGGRPWEGSEARGPYSSLRVPCKLICFFEPCYHHLSNGSLTVSAQKIILDKLIRLDLTRLICQAPDLMYAGIMVAVGNKMKTLPSIGLCSRRRTDNRLKTRDF